MNITSLGEITQHQRENRPDEVAMVYSADERQWTFKELDQEACQCASALQAMGVNSQDRVAYLGKNHPEYFAFLFGAGKLNAVTVPINWRLTAAEIEYTINNSESKVLLLSEDFLPMLAQMKLNLQHIVVIGAGGETPFPSYPDWIADQPDEIALAPASPDDICFQLYTSGTTGSPKGVESSLANMLALNKGLADLEYSRESVTMVCMPLFHIAGNGWAISALMEGSKCIIITEPDMQEILRTIPLYKITHTVFVPAVLQFLLMQPNVQDVNFDSLKVILYGASPISDKVLTDSFKTFQCDFFGTYGLTESTGGVTQLDAEDHDPSNGRPELLRSCGRPSNGHEIKIISTNSGEEITDGSEGEIWIRGPQVMPSYWKNEQATLEVLDSEGWLRSGDIGYFQEGYLYIHDRVKDMIISGGENIYPTEIENALMQHPAVADVAVIGVPDEAWGEAVKAMVCRTDPSISEVELIDYCRERLAHFKCPKTVSWMEQLPRNAAGKVLKTELREPFWQGKERNVS